MDVLSDFDHPRAVWLARHVLPHEAALRGWLRPKRGLTLDPDDVIQESYAILAALKSVDHIDNPRAYLFQTAKSLLLRDLRRAKIVSIEAVDDLESLGAVSDEASPEKQVSDRHEMRRLAALIETLPRRCQEVFRLRKIDGESQKAIARRLGLSEKTVEKHVAKAVHRLMDAMGRGGQDLSHASRESGRQSDHVVRKIREQPQDR